ncbi:hypothetical protein R5R35_002590 [Gryllus longicercus]|uniref:BHLH domain-containing protein n=1 Tax=Gryllus longicercus TaxID=2509291 RepID=A0AAN9VW80_9ORTH
MWPVVTEDTVEDRGSITGKGLAMSERDAGFCSGGEELECEGAASAASAGGGGGGGVASSDADEALSPTDASEDSVEVRVRPVAPPPQPLLPPPPSALAPPPPPLHAPAPAPGAPAQGPKRKASAHAAPPPPKKRRRATLEVEDPLPLVPAAPAAASPPVSAPVGGPFRPWSIDPSEAYAERLRLPEALRLPLHHPRPAHDRPALRPAPERRFCGEDAPEDRLRPAGEPLDRLRASPDAARARLTPRAPPAVKAEPATPGADDRDPRFSFAAALPPGRAAPATPERARVKTEAPATTRLRPDSADGRYAAFRPGPARSETCTSSDSAPRIKTEPAGSSASSSASSHRGETSGGFSVAALLGGGTGAATPGPSSSSHAHPGGSASGSGSQQQSPPPQQRNYKNMTRERRIEANARERTRVHTISAAFDTLRRAVPAYSHAQKLSKLSVLRVACAYILTLSRAAGKDYSADASAPSLESCVDLVTRTIHTEGKLRRKRDE